MVFYTKKSRSAMEGVYAEINMVNPSYWAAFVLLK